MAVKIPKGRLVHGPFKPICRDCAIYFSITVGECLAILAHRTSEAKYLGSMKPFSEGEPGSLGNRPRVPKDPYMSQESGISPIILFWGWDVSTINPTKIGRGLDS